MQVKQLNWRNGIAKTPFGEYSVRQPPDGLTESDLIGGDN